MHPPRNDAPGSGSLRITSGELRNRRLLSPPPSGGVRPTAERTREAIFSILGPLAGESVLDLFCGSGAMGLEALSRGAAQATLVDLDTRTAAANVEALDQAHRCQVLMRDAFEFLAPPAAATTATTTYGLVFCDPPYRLADRLGQELDRVIVGCLERGSRVVVESAAADPLRLSLPLLRERRYGTAFVAVYGSGR